MTEAERQELLELCDLLLNPRADIPGSARRLATWAKSQLSRQPEAAEVAAIRARHEDDAIDEHKGHGWAPDSYIEAFHEAHADRATLLTLVDAQARALSVSTKP